MYDAPVSVNPMGNPGILTTLTSHPGGYEMLFRLRGIWNKEIPTSWSRKQRVFWHKRCKCGWAQGQKKCSNVRIPWVCSLGERERGVTLVIHIDWCINYLILKDLLTPLSTHIQHKSFKGVKLLRTKGQMALKEWLLSILGTKSWLSVLIWTWNIWQNFDEQLFLEDLLALKRTRQLNRADMYVVYTAKTAVDLSCSTRVLSLPGPGTVMLKVPSSELGGETAHSRATRSSITSR